MKKRLTVKSVEAAKVRTGERLVVRDTDLPGFALVVHASGKKVFVLRYGTRNRRRQIPVGLYGALTVDEAREKAKALLGRIADGEDPGAEYDRQRATPTVGEWVKEYLPHVEARKRSARDDRRYLALAAEKWGRLLVTELTSDHVAKVFQTFVKAGKRTTANRFLASVRACLQAAWRQDLISVNPATKVRALPEGDPRSRVLSDAEQARLVKAVDGLKDPHVRAAFMLLIVTGCRLSEVLRARWDDVDLDGGLWRIPRAKSGKVEVIPLPDSVVSMLRGLPRVGSLVVPGRLDPNRRRPDLSGPWGQLREAAELTGVHVHDLRRTAGLAVARSAGLHVASKYLRHTDIRVTERHYAPLGIDELRKVAETQAGPLAGPLARVLPMPEKRRKRAAQ